MVFGWRPSNPDDDFYLTVCFVCEEVAKPGQTHMRNYGGTVCFSCRQFFRRAHQNGKVPSLTCKNNSKCHITVTNRRKCQTCRYKLCRMAGMCPDAVLSEDQKKVRFQRMIRKREAALTLFPDTIRGNFNTSENRLKRPVGEPLHFSPPGKFARFDLGLNPAMKLHLSSSNHPTVAATNSGSKDQPKAKNPGIPAPSQKFHSKQTIPVQWPKTLKPKVEEILDLYNLAMEKFALEGFIDHHKFVPQHIAKFSKAFCVFANSCRAFDSLPFSDREKLLKRNSFLFTQMCIAFFVLEASPAELKTLNKLFIDRMRMDEYLKLARELTKINQKTIRARSVCAYALLFLLEDFKSLENPFILEELQLIAKMLMAPLLDEKDQPNSIKILSETLKKMNEISLDNMIIFPTDFNCSLSNEISVVYSMDEEFWLKNQLDYIQKAQLSIPLGEDIMREYLMFSIGVQPPQNFLSNVCQVFAERIWKILETQQQFAALSEHDKREIISTRGCAALLLIFARQDVIFTGLKQCKEMFGECHDIETTLNCQLVLNRPTNMKKFWLQKSCYNTLSTTAINKITLKDIVDVSKRRDNVKFVKGFAELTKGFQQQLLDSLLHRIMLVLVLTKSDKLESLHRMYLRTYWRRMSWISQEGSRRSNATLNKVSQCIQSIFKLKRMFELMI